MKNSYSSFRKPSIDEFCEYVEEKGYDLDPYDLYKEFDDRGWTTLKGVQTKSWERLIDSRNSQVCRTKKKTSKPHQIEMRRFRAYVKAVGNWDGSAMGCGYLITENDDTYDEGLLGLVGVRSYEAEFRGIVDLLKKIPDDSLVTVFTNQKYLEYLSYYKQPSRGDNFYELRKALWKEKKRLVGVSVVYMPKRDNGVYLNSAEDMAEEEFLAICETKGIRNQQMSYSA